MGDEQLKRMDMAGGVMFRDGPAFAEVARRDYPAVYLTALSIVRDRDMAEDVTQETFLRAWLKIDTLRDANLIQPWLGRIVRNLATQWLRTGQQRSRVLPLISLEEMTVEPADIVNLNPRQAAGQVEQQGQLADAVMALPEDLRQVVLLHYAEGMTPSDIARLNGEAPSTVTRRLEKARGQLREHLESGLAVSLAMLKPRPRQLEKTLGLLAAAVSLPAASRAQLLHLISDTPPPPMIDPVILAANAAPSEGAGIMKSIIAKAGAGKLVAAAAAAAVVSGAAYAVHSLTNYNSRRVGMEFINATTSRLASNNAFSETIALRGSQTAKSPAKRNTATATTNTSAETEQRKRLRPDERIALLKSAVVDTQMEVRKADGETTNRIYFNIEVVNESGQPVRDATIQMSQFKFYADWGSGAIGAMPHRWSPTITDIKGIARVSVPELVNGANTSGFDAYVAHSDYTVTAVDMSLDKITKVVLSGGDFLEVVAVDKSTSSPIISDVVAHFDDTHKPEWQQRADGTIAIRKISDGAVHFYLKHVDPAGKTLLSDYQVVKLPRDTDDQLRVPMRPALTVRGSLSANVPRPVTNGIVSARHEGRSGCSTFSLQEVAVAADGTFELTGLAPGRMLISALADGYSSVVPQGANNNTPHARAQEFIVDGDRQAYVLPMNPDSNMKIKLVAQDGEPVVGAEIVCGSLICYDSCCENWPEPFTAITRQDGVAVISGIPGGQETHLRVQGDWGLVPEIDHRGQESRTVQLQLVAGETIEKTLTVVPNSVK